MHFLLKAISYIFHPIIIPILAAIFYFSVSPRAFTPELKQAKLIQLFILTVTLPILLYFLLKTLGKVKSIHLKTTKERILPLLVNGFIVLLIIQRVVPPNQVLELYYFFVGVLASVLAALILAIFNIKASLHMMAIASIFMFFIALSIHFNININGTLVLITLIGGATASSRLYLKAHDVKELSIGFFIGILPQLIMLNYWL